MNNLKNPELPKREILLESHNVFSYRIDKENAKDSLNKIYRNWKKLRELFPGWVILPNSNRKILFDNTKYYIEPILEFNDVLDSPFDILLIYELFWRLNKCLISLSIEDEVLIEKLLDKYCPFEELKKDVPNIITPDSGLFDSSYWSIISEAWLFLHSLLISDARRDLNLDKFNKRSDDFRLLEYKYEELSDFLSYESCLFTLSKFDEKKLKEIINKWSLNNSSIHYQARKASILTEIGDYDNAMRIGINALNELRTKYDSNEINYYLMSIEGWLMILLNLIDSSENWEMNKDRFETLSKYKCNPWDEINILQKELDIPIQLENPITEKKITFDIDREVFINHFGGISIIEKLLPAISFLRIFEETCLPFSSKYSFQREYIFKSANCIRLFFPLWSLSSILRTHFNQTDKLDEFIDRIYIATMSKDNYKFILDTFFPSYIDSISNLILLKNESNLEYVKKSFIALSDIISKLSLRFDELKREELFKLLINLYNSPFLRKSNSLQKAFQKTIKRLFESMTQIELIKALPKIIDIPIANEKGFEVKPTNDWMDPIYYFDFDVDFDIQNKPIINGASIDKIISSINEDKTRDDAIFRVYKIYKLGYLSELQIQNFMDALYSKIDEYGLPTCSRLLKNAYLSLPNNKQVINTYRKKFINIKIPLVADRIIEKGKVTSLSYSDGENTKLFLNELRNVSKPLFRSENVIKYDYLVWDNNEALILLDKFIKWWDEEKNEIIDGKSKFNRSTLSDILKDLFKLMDIVLSRVVFPNISNFSCDYSTKIEKLKIELKEKNISFFSSDVILLKHNEKNRVSLFLEICNSLNSYENEKIEKAFDALLLWCVNSYYKNIVNPPEDISSLILNRLLIRRNPGLFSCIFTVNQIVKYLPNYFSLANYELIINALEYLFDETKYPEERFSVKNVKEYTFINYVEIPKYRDICSTLAYNTYKYFIEANHNIPNILIKWKEAAKQDPLPEIRYYWINSCL